jgi:uncharacterized protein
MTDGWTAPGQPQPPDPAGAPPAYPGAGPYPYGAPYGGVPQVRRTGFAAPAGEPRPYSQLMRSPSFRWWRPLLSLVAGLAAGVVLLFAVVVAMQAAAAIAGAGSDDLEKGALGFVAGNLLLAAAIPMSMIGIALGFLRPPGWLASVELRLRWWWVARCSVWLVLWALAGTALWFALDGPPGTGGKDAALIIVLCLLTTPLQAAGEEYMMRGWLTQVVGSWLPRPEVGAVVAALVSATVFAFLHGTQNAWLFGDRWAFGIIASYLVWRTGGLEASIALHTISNISAIIPSALEGTLDDSLTVTEAPIGTVAVDVVLLLIAAAIIVKLAKRHDVRRVGPVAADEASSGPPAVAAR